MHSVVLTAQLHEYRSSAGRRSLLPIIGGRQNRLTLGIEVRPLLDWQNLSGDKTPYSVHLRLGSAELRPLIKRNQPRVLGLGSISITALPRRVTRYSWPPNGVLFLRFSVWEVQPAAVNRPHHELRKARGPQSRGGINVEPSHNEVGLVGKALP